jgi:hypothetical protein
MSDQDPATRVCALVDSRLCGLAAVRGAMPLAAHAGASLVVLFRRPRRAYATVEPMPPPEFWYPALESDTFFRVAAIMAPSGLPWDFRVTDASPGRSRRSGRPGELFVIAAHSHGPPWFGLRRAGRAGTRGPVTIACDSRATASASSRADALRDEFWR